MRWLAVSIVVAGCGFQAGGGVGSDAAPDDGASMDDGPLPGDAPMGDATGGDATQPDAAVDAMDGACPNHIPIGLSGSSYLEVGGSAQAWADAEMACEQAGSHLLVLDDATETTVLATANLFGTNNVWLGVSDRITAGTFLAVTDQMTFLEPTANASNHCARRKSNGTIEARSCTETNVVICECDGRAVVPGNF